MSFDQTIKITGTVKLSHNLNINNLTIVNDDMIKLLEKSINEKWIPIVDGKKEELGIKDCPLCLNYVIGTNCTACPISQITRLTGCNGTPYIEWLNYFDDHPFYKAKSRVIDEKSKQLAINFRDFLINLLRILKDKNKKNTEVFKTGQIFKCVSKDSDRINDTYILSQINVCKIQLISLNNGNRIQDNFITLANNCLDISKKELFGCIGTYYNHHKYQWYILKEEIDFFDNCFNLNTYTCNLGEEKYWRKIDF